VDDKKKKQQLLDKYITEFHHHTEEQYKVSEVDTQHQSKQYRKLTTKEDVFKILRKEYINVYKDEEKEYVDSIFKYKTIVKDLNIKKTRIDKKTKEYEKNKKQIEREISKLQTKSRNLNKKIIERNKISQELESQKIQNRKIYQEYESDLKTEVYGEDNYYFNYFKMFVEIQQLYDGGKIYIDRKSKYPRWRLRVLGGSGRGGFDLTDRIGVDLWKEINDKYKGKPKDKDIIPYIYSNVEYKLKEFFSSDKFRKYLIKKTRPIGSGYGKRKRLK